MVVKNKKGVIIIAHNGKRELEITRVDDGLLVSPIKCDVEKIMPFSNVGINVTGSRLFSGNVRFSEIAIQEQLITIAHEIGGINLPGSEAAKASYIIMRDIPSVRVSALEFAKSLSKINEKLYALTSIPD